MSLRDLMRKGSLRAFATATPATLATDRSDGTGTVATVATAAVATDRDSAAANDPAPGLGSRNVTGLETASPATVAKFRAANLALDRQMAVAGGAEPDPDRYCWPASSAMNGREIERFTARMAGFIRQGQRPERAEALADELVIRERGTADQPRPTTESLGC